MNELIEIYKTISPPTFIFITAGIFILFAIREYYRFTLKLRKIRKKKPLKSEMSEKLKEGGLESYEINIEGEKVIYNIHDSSQVVDLNFRLLESYYEQSLTEYKLMSRSSLIVAVFGFLVIVFGVVLTFSEYTGIGIISVTSGLVTEATSVLFFRQNRILIDQVKEYHRKLVSTQYLLTSISLAKELPEEEAIKKIDRIIGNLLFLSNQLHDSSSDHLFDSTKEIDSNESRKAR